MSTLEPPDGPEAASVSGDLVEGPEATVVPSTATQNLAADRARGRTTIQVGIPTAIVGLGVWVARLNGVDLNPLPGQEDIPPEVAGYFVALVAVALAFWMNPKTKD